MALYDMTDIRNGSTAPAEPGERLSPVQRTTFAKEGIQERGHLQAALRDRIEVIDEGLFVVAEEFGDFEGVYRRIDLLCVDKDCRLVVVELKRTADGGHMELQALRYAAMISTMTFSQVVKSLAKYRQARDLDDHTEETARSDLLTWLDHDEDDEPVVSREVGIVLASEDFSQEITTTVLWLNEFHGFDIRCLRLSPYRHDHRLLLDVQQVIPLPEASLYTVRVREKEKETRKASAGTFSPDNTKFVVQTPAKASELLPKRWAMLRLVEGLAEAGVDMDKIRAILPDSKTLRLPGTYADPDALWQAIQAQFGKSDDSRKRWHLSDPIVLGDETWVLNNNWGDQTRRMFKELLEVAPDGFAVYEEGDVPESLP